MCRHQRSCIRLFSLSILLPSVVIPSPTTAQPDPARSEQLVPANFNPTKDAKGFQWDFSPMGTIGDGSDDCFDNAAVLDVAGSSFRPAMPKMTAKGELVLTGRSGSVEVTRRIKVDRQHCYARYVESFRNTGSSPQTLSVSLRTDLGGRAEMIATDSGTLKPGALGKKDGGLLALQQGSRSPSVLFFLSASRSRIKPALHISGNERLTFTYSLRLKPGETVSILHAVAQRRPGGIPDRKTRTALFKPFRDVAFVRDLPAALRKTIVNWTGSEPDAGQLPTLAALYEQLDIASPKTDLLLMDETARVAGTARCESIRIRTPHGRAGVTLDEVAAVLGGGGAGKTPRLYLRNGEILAGTIDAPGLALTNESDWSISLDPRSLHALVLRASPPPAAPAAAAFIETHHGDRLAIAVDPPPAFDVATPWGPLPVSLDRLDHLARIREPIPSHRLVLRDGTRLPVFLGGEPLAVRSHRFGPVSIPPQTLTRLLVIRPSGKPEPEEAGEEESLPIPHCRLRGGAILAGRIALPAVPVSTSTGTTRLETARIRGMRRDKGQEQAVFTIALTDGGTLSGRLATSWLPVRSGDRTWRIPVEQFLSVHVPKPKAPEKASPEKPATPEEAKPEGSSPKASSSPRPADPFSDAPRR